MRKNIPIWSVIAFMFAFFIVKEFVQTFHGGSEQEQVTKAAAYLDKMRANAVKEKPDVPAAVAYQQKATEVAAAQVAALTGEKKAEKAADIFSGFFAVNTKARPAFCNEQGIDIPAWTAAFEKVNARETARARQIHAKAGTDEDHWFALMADQMKRMTTDDMKAIADSFKISLQDACKLFQDHADEIATKMSFEISQPTVFKALMTP